MGAGLPVPVRVALWDAATTAIGQRFRNDGVRLVSTPVRVAAPSLEPYIEPIRVPGGYLATSPELAMKRLLAAGSGSIYQISHCFRRAERGRLHREEFHLLEWYRTDATPRALMADTESIVGEVFEVAAGLAASAVSPPTRWHTVGLLDWIDETTGVALVGDEDAAGLRIKVGAIHPGLCQPLAPGLDEPAQTLMAWTNFFSSWSDAFADSWLSERPNLGIHVVDFPPPLAALSECGAPVCSDPKLRPFVAHRFESHVAAVELCNGYQELSCPAEQRTRFERVGRMRAALGQEVLPLDEGFLADLGSMPHCAGAALGLDRLLMLAGGAGSLAEISLFPPEFAS